MNKSSALDFNPDRMIAELEQLVADKKKAISKSIVLRKSKHHPYGPRQLLRSWV